MIEGPYLLWLKTHGPIYTIQKARVSQNSAASRQRPGGGAGGEPPETLRILYFTVPEKELKTRLKTLSYHGEILPVL